MNVYRVFDTIAGKYWTSPSGKTVWNQPGHAKNAWNCACSWGGRGKFGDNPHMKVYAFQLVRENSTGV